MMVELTEALWLDERDPLSLEELAQLSGLSSAELLVLVEFDTLPPFVGVGVAPAAVEPAVEVRFGADCLVLARTASRLRDDFDLDVNALALTLRLLNRIHELEAELLDLRAQGPRPIR